MFITFEGGEGVGKSTQIELLKQHLQRQGKEVVSTREPGGTELADKLRAIILSGEGVDDPLLEYTIVATARRDHIINLIKPALAAGKWVLCDRFYDSSVVYQGLVKQLDLKVIKQLHDILSEGMLPELTILLELDIESAQQRIGSRKGELTHYDKQGLSFHQKIRNGFLQIAQQNPERVKLIDGLGSQEDVHERIVKLLERR